MSRSLWRFLETIAVLSVGPKLHVAGLSGSGTGLATTADRAVADASPCYLLSYRADRSAHRYLEWAWKDPLNLVTRPLYWHGSDWRTFAVDAGVTGALFPADDDLRDLFQHNHTGAVDSSLNAVRDVTAGGDTYFVAGAGSAERMNDNRHWLSDVVGGAFLGEVVGKHLVHFHYRRDVEGVLQPYVTPDSAGMEMTFRF